MASSPASCSMRRASRNGRSTGSSVSTTRGRGNTPRRRPARAGVMALRGHGSIQGSTDIPTLYHSIHGYMNHPSALKRHDSLRDWLLAETTPRGYWANTPKFMVSYLKSMYGAAATKGNDFGYDWHPKITGDHSHIPMFLAMNEGSAKRMLGDGQNPPTSLNASAERKRFAKH